MLGIDDNVCNENSHRHRALRRQTEYLFTLLFLLTDFVKDHLLCWQNERVVRNQRLTVYPFVRKRFSDKLSLM